MPPFQLPERIVTLVFKDGPLKGLELEVRLGVPFDFYFDLTDLAAKSSEESGLDALRSLMRRFASEALVAWNLTDRDGKPVPPTADAFIAKVDPVSGGLMLARYLSAIGDVPSPLARASANGRTSRAHRESSSLRS